MSSLRLAVLLRTVRAWTIELHADHLRPGADDDEVVALCGKQGFTIVTCDDMRYTPETMAAMVAYGVGFFKISSANANTERKAAAIIVASDRMIRLAHENKANAFCAHVRLDGHVQHMVDAFKDFPPRTASQQRTERKYGPIFSLKG